MEENLVEPQPLEAPVKPARNWTKIVLFSFIGVFLASGLVFAGIQIGRKQSQLSIYPTPAPPMVASPTPVAAVIPTQVAMPTSISDLTAGWKIFTYQEEKFSLKYPSSWIITGQDSDSGMILQTSDLKFKDYSNVEKGAFIYFPYAPGNVAWAKSLDDLFIRVNQDSVGKKIILEETNLTLDGQPAKKRVFKKDNSAEVQVVFQYPKTLDGVNYSFIILISEVKDFDAPRQLFDQILSTFKFLP